MSGLTYLGDTIQEFGKSDIVNDNTKCLLTTNSNSTNQDRNVSAIKLSNFRKWISETINVTSNITVNTKCCLTFINTTSSFTLNISEPYQQVFIVNTNEQTFDKNIVVTITGSKSITVASGSKSCELFPSDSCRVFASGYQVTYVHDKFIDKAYPVGTYYYTSNNISPSRYFGGTWAQITGRFLLNEGTYASGYTYGINSTGGEVNHTLTTAEMPAHTHTFTGHTHTWSQFNDNGAAAGGGDREDTANRRYMYRLGSTSPRYSDQFGFATSGPSANSGNATTSAGVVFGTGAHNNMPRYMQSYCWRRDG